MSRSPVPVHQKSFAEYYPTIVNCRSRSPERAHSSTRYLLASPTRSLYSISHCHMSSKLIGEFAVAYRIVLPAAPPVRREEFGLTAFISVSPKIPTKQNKCVSVSHLWSLGSHR